MKNYDIQVVESHSSRIAPEYKLKIKKTHQDAIVPKYQTSGASGFDLHSLSDYSIYPGETILVDTGIAFEIPNELELQIRPRSGLSLKTDLRIANAPGTIDSDFRDSVKIIIQNISSLNRYQITKGERIAQGVICPVLRVSFNEVEVLSDTIRGTNGFGSTGT